MNIKEVPTHIGMKNGQKGGEKKKEQEWLEQGCNGRSGDEELTQKRG